MSKALDFPVTKLYRDCLKLAEYIGSQSPANKAVVAQSLKRNIRTEFRRNQHETDPQKIDECKEAAVRGLSNYMFHEAQRMAKADSKGKGADKHNG
jgi:hypothetical protein